MTSTNRVIANALMSLEELLKKQGLSRAEFDKMMKEMKDKGASAVHYMRGKDGRLLFKADGTTIGNAVANADPWIGKTVKVKGVYWITMGTVRPDTKFKVVKENPKGGYDLQNLSGGANIYRVYPTMMVVANSVVDNAVVQKALNAATSSVSEKAVNAKYKVGDRVRIIGGGVETIARVYPKGQGTGLGPQEVDFYATRESGGFITDEDISGVANSRACNSKWVIMYRDGGKEKIEAPSHAEAKKIAEAKSKKSGRGYTSVIVDDGVDYDRWQFFNAKACNSTNPIVRKAMNAVARNGVTTDEATAKRDIEQSLRKMADFAAKFTGAKVVSAPTHSDYNYAGYIELTFPTDEEADDYNPYYLIYKLRDNNSLLPKWAWGVGGFNYKQTGRTWHINIGRFAT